MIKVSLGKQHPLLVCPKSRKPLILGQDGLFTSNEKFSLVDGTPWLFRNGANALAHWKKKIQDVFDFNNQRKLQLENALAKNDLLDSTQRRLKKMVAACQKQSSAFAKVLGAFISESEQNEILSLDRVPKQQSALSYQTTFFRDWVWGKEQVKEYATLIEKHLVGKKRLAFPGAGACGLPLLIHNRIRPDISLAMDINPMLVAPVQRLLRGEKIESVEIPQMPNQPDALFIEQEVKLEEPIAPGFELVYCDAQNMPVQDQSLDGIVTSWFIDIVPMDFRQLAKNFNSSLEVGGVWCNIGQLGFEKNDLSQAYGPEEIREILVESGFEIIEFEKYQLPYLQSPYSGIGRLDSIWTFSAVKRKHFEANHDWSYLPNWLLDFDQAVPVDETVRHFKVRSVIYNFVIEQVEGQKSLHDIAQALSETFGLPLDEAKKSVHNFFTNFYEGLIYREF